MRRIQAPSAQAAFTPLDAVPVASLHVRREPRADVAGLVLWLSTPARGRLAMLLEKRFGFTRARAFELDEVGASFWNAIDGTRSLVQIQSTLSRQFGLEEAAARRAVLEFTSLLMRRGLVSLRMRSGEHAR